jgi:hypothetical protein
LPTQGAVHEPLNARIGTDIIGGRMPLADRGRQAGQIANALFESTAPALLGLPEVMPMGF